MSLQPQSKNNNTMLEISFDLFAQNMQKYTRYSHTNHCKHKKFSGMYISHLDGRRIQSSCRQDRGGVAGGGRPGRGRGSCRRHRRLQHGPEGRSLRIGAVITCIVIARRWRRRQNCAVQVIDVVLVAVILHCNGNGRTGRGSLGSVS